MAAARKDKISPMELCERITDGDQLPAGLKPAIKKNLASFVGIIRKLRKAAQKVCLISRGLADEQGTSVADLLRMMIEKTGYEEHLRKTQQDFDSRWENVQELASLHFAILSDR
jgi:DNA helicase-2/ATP-dependent DNA helicase PcrA